MKGRKRTKKLAMTAPWETSPEERVKYAAKNLAETAVAADPGMGKLVGDLSQAARQGASKIVRGKGVRALDRRSAGLNAGRRTQRP